MYYLPLYINHRRYHYCRLLPQGSQTLTEPFHFIIEHHPGFRPVLVRLTDGMQLLSGKGTAHDIALKDRRLKATSHFDPDRNHFTLNLEVASSERRNHMESLNADLKDAPFLWEENDGHWMLRYTGPDQPSTFGFQIRMQHGEESFQGHLYLHLGQSEQIFDAVFDFGSEASQIASKQRSREARRDQRINLLDRLLFDFYAPALKEGRLERKAIAGQEGQLSPWNVDYLRYYQYDPDDQKLFRSSFLVRRTYPSLLDQKESISASPFAEGNNEWVSILGDTYDPLMFDPKHGDSYELIPNLKLAELGFIRDFKLQIGNRLAHFSDAKIHESVLRRLMNQFLHLLLSELESNHPKEANKLLRLTLLVPNIYSQERIYHLLENLQQDFAQIRSAYGYGFSGLEIQTLSESDASFLGLLSDPSVEGMHVHELKAGENYLVIDVGKGTTDLSIVQVGDERDQFSSIFRSGFAGAGNAITFAFAESLAAVVADHYPSIDRADVLQQILDTEIQQKLQLMQWMEDLKKNFDGPENKSLNYEELDMIRDLNPSGSTFLAQLNRTIEVEMIRNNKSIKDYYGFIEYSIQQIVQRTLDLVKRSGIKKFPVVVLSGRGFLFQRLRKAMEMALENEFEVGRFLLEEKKLKTSCLYGPLNFPAGTNKNSDLVGTPVVSERSGLPSIRSLIFRKTSRPKDRTYSETDLHEDEFYLQGQAMDLSNQRITISGRELMLPGTLMSEGDDEVNLLFTGHAFLARTPNGCVPLQFGHEGHDNPLSDALAWKSLFPYVTGSVPVSPKAKTPKRVVSQSTRAPELIPDLEMLSISDSAMPQEKRPKANEPSLPATEKQEDDMWDYL